MERSGVRCISTMGQEETMFLNRAVSIFAAAALLAALPAACGKKSPKPDAAEPSATTEQSEPEEGGAPEAEEIHPARAGLDSLLEIGADAPLESQLTALHPPFADHLRETALARRDEVVRLEGVGMPEMIRRLKEMLEKQGKKIKIDGNFIKNFSEESEKKAQALFGMGCKDLKAKPDEEVVAIWFARNWTSAVLPGVKDAFLEDLHDLYDRVYLFFQTGGSGRTEIAMFLHGGKFLYAGTREQRKAYMRGPERATLFDLLSESEKQQAAESDLQILASALLNFKTHMERYPSGIEGLEGLFAPPAGPESQKWLGPYAETLYDPWGFRFRLEVPGKNNPDFYDIWSPGPDGRDGTQDDVTNW
jgi:general secretion pathway protein G